MAAGRCLKQCLLVCFLMLLVLGASGCIERERKALLQFKHGLADDLGILSSWGGEQHKRDCCQWRGVRCSNRTGHDHVVILNLPAVIQSQGTDENVVSFAYQSLRGDVSPSLVELEHLTYLDLSDVNFEGIRPLPSFLASLTKLQYLNLSSVNANGPLLPNHLGNLSNLLSLDLSGNYGLHCENLDWLSSLSSLRHLSLVSVDLSKATHWSRTIDKLPSLVHLNLGGCNLPPLTSSPSLFLFNASASLAFVDLSINPDLDCLILDTFGNMGSLTHLDLSDDQLRCSMPDGIGKMNALVYLDLSYNQLHGMIPNALGKMISLTYLDLSHNLLRGSIPNGLSNKSSLVHFDLSDNQLDGPLLDGFRKMSSLTFLDLSSNQLQGSIPDGSWNMNSSVRYLDLSNNQLKGSIPDGFWDMISVSYLYLSANQLHGSIPDAVGNMSSLEQLDLGDNRFEGEIPKPLSNLCNLHKLHLGGNNLSGEFPQDLLACANETLEELTLSNNHRLRGAISEAHVFNLSHLAHLDLSSTSLIVNMSSEWVPPFQLERLLLASCKLGQHRIPGWLQTQNQLFEVDISNCGIRGAIPDWFWNITNYVASFNISKNHFTGTLSNFSPTFYLPLSIYIDASSNQLEGSIPQLTPYFSWIDLSHNKFSGSISLLCNVSYSKYYLSYLDLSNNLLSGALPEHCLSKWKSLIILNLENNRFSGKIPKSVGSSQSLRTLHLRNNNLSGKLPSSLKNCTSLKFIDLAKNRLSGEIPSWIGGSLPNLVVLNLRSNRFNGVICLELCQLKKLQILDLSDNNISGTIPRCLNNFEGMTKKGNSTIAYSYSLKNPMFHRQNLSYAETELVKWKGKEFEYRSTLGLVKSIDFSSNQLTGEIPKEVTDLLELVSLNISRNNLTGLIPTAIGRLKSLEVLDLSHNHLVGEIPNSLAGIDRLGTLELSCNNLYGRIPQGGHLQSFKPSSYDENPTLCGLPLVKKCPGDGGGTPNIHILEDDTEEDGNDVWFYLGIAVGFIVGFWGVCGALLLNRSWTNSYFRCLNHIRDWLYVTITINMARLRRSLQR